MDGEFYFDMEKIRNLRKVLHAHAEPSMHEKKTKNILMEFIQEHTHTLLLTDRGSWFYVTKKGKTGGHPIAFRADFDAVTCPDGVARHLCGHDGHSAILAGFSLWLDQTETDRDVYLIFQPGEESGEGAAICSSLIEEKKIEEIYGFHNIPGDACGEILLLPHTFACASTGLELTFQGKQSHAAYPEMGANPAAAIAGVIQAMHAEILQPHKGIVLGTVIGIEAGSASYGVSAGDGILRLTLRAEYQEEFDSFVANVEKTAKALAKENGLNLKICRIEEFPATINHKASVQKILKAAKSLNLTVKNPKEPFRWSEDFGYYLQKTDGAFFGVGCGESHAPLHTMEYEFEDGIIGDVVRIYQKLVLG